MFKKLCFVLRPKSSPVGWAKCRPKHLVLLRDLHGMLPTINGRGCGGKGWATLRFYPPYKLSERSLVNVAQMEQSGIWDFVIPDSAMLHPGYRVLW